MRNLYKFILLCSSLILTACQTHETSSQITSKTVNYTCGINADQPIEVTYYFHGKKVIGADLDFQGRDLLNFKIMPDQKDIFYFNNPDDFVWSVDKFNINSVKQAEGNMLYKHTKDQDEVIVKYCSIKNH